MAKFQEIVQQAAFRSMNLHSTATAKARVRDCLAVVARCFTFECFCVTITITNGRSWIDHRSPYQSEPDERNAEMRTVLETLGLWNTMKFPTVRKHQTSESFQIHQAHYTLIDLFVNGEGTLHQLHKRRKMKVFDAPSLRKTLQQQQQKRQTPYKKS